MRTNLCALKGHIRKTRGVADVRFVYYTFYGANLQENCFKNENIKFHPYFSRNKPICKVFKKSVFPRNLSHSNLKILYTFAFRLMIFFKLR